MFQVILPRDFKHWEGNANFKYFLFFVKSCSTWEIILIDSKQLKVNEMHNTAQ